MRIHSCLLLLSLMSGCIQPTYRSDVDPYRWLESPVTDPRVSSWLAQQALTTQAWRQQQSTHHQIREQLRAAWDYPKWLVADIKREQVFFYFNRGMEDHYSLYQQPFAEFMAERDAGGTPGDSARLLIDGAAFGDNAGPGDISISPDAGWLAYQVNRQTPSGVVESLWHLQSLTARSPVPELLGVHHEGWTLPAERLAWGRQTGTLFFTVSMPLGTVQAGLDQVAPAPENNWQSRVYAYQAGMALSTAGLIYTESAGHHIEQLHVLDSGENPECGAPLGNTLLAAVSGASLPDVSGWRVFATDPLARDELAPAKELHLNHSFRHGQSPAQYVGTIHGNPVFLSAGARGNGVITLAEGQQARVLIAETETPLRAALVVGQRLVLEYLVHGSSTLRVFDLDGHPEDDGGALTLPAPVRVEALRATGEQQLLVSYSGILTPPVSDLVDVQTLQRTTLRQDQPTLSWRESGARLIRISAGDGVRIPVWIAGPALASDHDPDVMLLEVYGGFAAPMETSFSISRLAWIASGAAYAVAGPRGGGDYGKHWHDAGSGEHRHNSISDVVAVAHWLRREWLSETGQLVISGRSHGGLLATEVVHRAPGMFTALVTDAALTDLARLDALGGARFWHEEYRGFVSSPYQTLLSGGSELNDHPPVLMVARVNDPVVAPAHSFKYVQVLQDKTNQAPFRALLSVVPGSGHDSSGPVNELIDDYALRWTFLRSRVRMALPPD